MDPNLLIADDVGGHDIGDNISTFFTRQIPRDLVDAIRLVNLRNNVQCHNVTPTFGHAIRMRPMFSARDIPS